MDFVGLRASILKVQEKPAFAPVLEPVAGPVLVDTESTVSIIDSNVFPWPELRDCVGRRNHEARAVQDGHGLMDSERAPKPIFIDFEGIDGSGKTTLSNRLADYLKEQGIPVHHARDQGVFRSEISKEIRQLTRNPRFLRMSDVTEFLLYVARDTQSIDEYIRPKLLPGHIVMADRYLYSTITHSHYARGIAREDVDAVLRVAARGLWPDLVVYCDVDPLTSRMRKKIQKVRDKRELGDFGRKGLMGIGFREEMRHGFLELANEDPQRWLVIDNANATIDESLQRIFDRVLTVLDAGGHTSVRNPHWCDLSRKAEVPATVATPSEAAADSSAAGGPTSLATHVAELVAMPDETERRRKVFDLFFAELRVLADANPGYTALFTGGMDLPEAHELRRRVIDREPAMVAYGLQGLRSPEAIQFRQELKDREPEYVARSLSGVPLEHLELAALRDELAAVAPRYIALSIRGRKSEAAWALRERLLPAAPREVLLSLRGIDIEPAWDFRGRLSDPQYYPALLESLGGIDGPRAWEWRDELSETYLPWVLMSVRGVTSERAWKLRQDHIARAPKIIIRTIGRSQDPRAWELREQAKEYAKEVLDSLSGLDNGPAWALRMELKDKWPNTAVSSLGASVQSERSWRFRWDMLRQNPTNLLLMKHLVKATLRTLESLEGQDEEEAESTDFT